LARGAFLVCLAYLLLDVSVQATDRPVWIREAKSGPYLHEGADVMRGFLHESLKAKSAGAAEELMRTIDPKGEADKAMRALTNPTPAGAPKSDATPGSAAAPKSDATPAPDYKSEPRREMNRMIQNNTRQ
jgi:membrane protein required for colicin V production